MNQILKIEKKYADSVTNLALDTLKNNKQALIFVNTKRSAEKCAEEISKKLKQPNNELLELSVNSLKAVQKPTKQCRRLSTCLEKGIAFHHASLHSKQKDLIESNFRKGNIKIICCTPTLAAGLDLPAFRAIIRDVKRYTGRGMQNIPVLEYLQMSGRAGRPSYDKYGEAILVSSSDSQKNNLMEEYVNGEPEDIYSKLAVEPVLRTYLLSLISTKVIQTKDQILNFFEKTFWAFQFKDMHKLEKTIIRMLKLLESWEFIQFTDNKFRATLLGKRIAELYIDPLTASEFVQALNKADENIKHIALLQLVSNTLEMRPLLRVKLKEYDDFQEELTKYENYFLSEEPSMFDAEYDFYLNSVKTCFMLNDWIEEKDDDFLMENYDAGPGIVRIKIETANWLLYALYEIARIQQRQNILKDIIKLKFRLKYGAKEELLSLLRLKNIGRVRARKLFRANLKNISDVKNAKPEVLTRIIGSKKLAEELLNQTGAKIEKNNNKRQLSDFS